jgi:methylmalonyl-CoA mutase
MSASVAPAAERHVQLHVPRYPVRFVTAASLFDGHDAAINLVRRLLVAQGAEVVHLGHNRSVEEVVAAVVDEDVQGVAVSSYQGGHVEYFKYLVDRLREEGRGDARVYGGGGGVIVAGEIAELEAYGVRHIFSPADGQALGLARMVNVLIEECDFDLVDAGPLAPPGALDEAPHGALDDALNGLFAGRRGALARVITAIEAGSLGEERLAALRARTPRRPVVLGVTGTGGSGKSCLVDELVRRLRTDQDDRVRIAVLAVDPTRRRGSGGALLADRLRMGSIGPPQVYFRSIATRSASSEVPPAVPIAVEACGAGGFDLVVVETPGIGQGDSAIVELADVSLYVMTPEFGAPSQLEKTEMVALADVIALNKFDRRGAADALREVRRQWAREHGAGSTAPDDLPVFGTIASHLGDDGVTALYQYLRDQFLRGALASRGCRIGEGSLAPVSGRVSTGSTPFVPAGRDHYLAEIAETVRAYHARTEERARALRRADSLSMAAAIAAERGLETAELEVLAGEARAAVGEEALRLVDAWPETARRLSGEVPNGGEQQRASNRGAPASPGGAEGADDRGAPAANGGPRGPALYWVSLAGTRLPRVALPRFSDRAELLRWLRSENLPGRFPFTAGVFPWKREEEQPTRMFAGEGDPRRANRRFHLLAAGQPATRLSVAFDPVTLYGCDPDPRPDIYGRIGTSGVSVATLDDMKELFRGFDLCDPKTSVSMTINGPAPTILAMFFNTVLDQQVERFAAEHGRPPKQSEADELASWALKRVRGTVQADILKEDQGQNTCIFSTEFSLRAMGDVQEYFVRHGVGHFYSVSVSGYHIAEAGANPVTQVAFTLANAFTYVEAYLARGMKVDDFARNLSFFFSNGMDPEYTVIGRVARRIWAIAMRDRYGANERSQKLKYHIQTSGRSLHAQEMEFNDIRTTLQALCAIYDNANSLHTNAYDEAVTTPTPESVRRALAIQLIINNEWGLAHNENPLQGSFVVEQLTDMVEAAVLAELDRLSERGGVLGAMESGYQRGRIQDDSILYEQKKHDGTLPVIGVNTFVGEGLSGPERLVLARATDEEKKSQIARLRDFQAHHSGERPAALQALKDTVRKGGNVFEELMTTVRSATLGEISAALYEVGGYYRRSA